MNARYIVMISIGLLMLGALFTGAVQTLEAQPAPLATRVELQNVRDYSPAVDDSAPSYAVDGGVLFAGTPGAWTEVRTPDDIIVGSVTVDDKRPNVVYVGAASELAIYRSTDSGLTWQRVPLSTDAGGVTDIAVDSANRLVYAGTDTAGVFRLRDVGSSLLVGGQLLLDVPVRQVVADSTGANLAFVRTDHALYRAENAGLAWSTVENLQSIPTAIAIANTDPALVVVGTADRGVLASADGRSWSPSDQGLDMAAGVGVSALAVDPLQPERVYAAAQSMNGSASEGVSMSQVLMSHDAGNSWHALERQATAPVTELMAVSGTPGAVYAITERSRTPMPLFDEGAFLAENGSQREWTATSNTATTATDTGNRPASAWVIAALAAFALGAFVTVDLHRRGDRPMAQGVPLTALDTQTLPTVG